MSGARDLEGVHGSVNLSNFELFLIVGKTYVIMSACYVVVG